MLLNALKSLFRRKGTTNLDFQAVYNLYQQGRLDEAERECQALNGVARADIDYLQGLIAQKRGDLPYAAEALARAVSARGNEPSFYYSLGEVLTALGRHGAAIEHTERFLTLAAENDPRRVIACVTAGKSSTSLADPRRATAWFRRAMALDTSNHLAPLLVSSALYEQSKIEEAREALAMAANAGSYPLQLRRALMLPAIYESTAAIDATRERLSRDLDELLLRPADTTDLPESDIGILPFYLAYHHKNNVALMKKVQAAMRRAYPAAGPTPSAVRVRSDKVQVGFVSTYFFSHSIGRTTIGLIRDLPRDRFSVHVFAVDPQDDPLRREIETAADHYHRLPGALEAVRIAIVAAQLDVLIFADLGMHPLTFFLALWRLAPVQIVSWGHPETTGIDTVDYYLAAAGIAAEETLPLYSERLLRPDVFFLPGYARPALGQGMSRAAPGLPPDQHLYACMQPLFKLHPHMDTVFLEILRRDAQAQIVLLESQLAWADQMRERFKRTLREDAPRVRFLPRMHHQQFLATLAACDVALDPLYFGGTNSSCEALALGVPLVTLPGAHLYGRFTAALYKEMQFDKCIASSMADYAERAVRIATDKMFGDAARLACRERCGVLFERTDITRAIADLLASGSLVRN